MQLSTLLAGFEEFFTSNPVPEIEIKSVCDDSRKADENSVFIAIIGFETDGHKYIQSAYDKGCRVFGVQKGSYDEKSYPKDAFFIAFNDTREALSVLCARINGNPSDKFKLIGITDTKGKTTTALIIKHILDENGIKAGYIGTSGVIYGGVSFPTENTTPGSAELQKYLADMVKSGMDCVVMEVSSQALYLKRAFGITFDYTVFTGLGVDHIGKNEHPDFEHYKACKKSLFFDYNTKCTVFNSDDEYAREMINTDVDTVSVSTRNNADLRAFDAYSYNDGGKLGTTAKISFNGQRESVKLSMPGDFNLNNSLLALGVAGKLGVKLGDGIKALESVSIEGRFETVNVKPDRTFVIDFAHNGMALEAVLKVLKSYNPARLTCLFGSVGGRTEGRRKQLGDVSARYCDKVILTADNPDFEDVNGICDDIEKSYPDGFDVKIIPDREEAIKYALETSRAGDIVLLAGKGHENYQLVNGKKIPFSEKKIIEKYKYLVE